MKKTFEEFEAEWQADHVNRPAYLDAPTRGELMAAWEHYRAYDPRVKGPIDSRDWSGPTTDQRQSARANFSGERR
jgi:ABC-type nitrate/sulfonate/bicarbonate transport system substrate-binding protein